MSSEEATRLKDVFHIALRHASAGYNNRDQTDLAKHWFEDMVNAMYHGKPLPDKPQMLLERPF